MGNFVEFFLNPVEDRQKATETGKYSVRDVEFMRITVPGGNLVVEKEVTDQIREEHAIIYDKWKKGEEIPENGSPLKLWPPISPSQLKNCIGLHIRTVEQLADISDKHLQTVGPGARALKKLAQDWLRAASDTGVIAEEITSLKVENEELRRENDQLREDVERLNDLVNKPKRRRTKAA